MARIFAYGSSTTYGYHDTEGGGYADRLKTTMLARRIAGEHPRGDVYNFGQLGRTLSNILEHIDDDHDRYAYGRTIGMFMLGIGDSKIPPGQITPEVSELAFHSQLRRLGTICLERGIQPLYIGVPPIDERFTKPFTASGEIYTTENRLAYEAIVREHAESQGAPFIPIWEALGGLDAVERGVITDNEGLHLNAAGHKIIHDAVLPAVLSALTSPQQLAA